MRVALRACMHAGSLLGQLATSTPPAPDAVAMTLPFFIRALEFARENAATDAELHIFAQNVWDAARRRYSSAAFAPPSSPAETADASGGGGMNAGGMDAGVTVGSDSNAAMVMGGRAGGGSGGNMMVTSMMSNATNQTALLDGCQLYGFHQAARDAGSTDVSGGDAGAHTLAAAQLCRGAGVIGIRDYMDIVRWGNLTSTQ